MIYQNVNEKNLSTGWNYLLFETKRPMNGKVMLNSLFIKDNIDMSIPLDKPKVGETKVLNQHITLDGFNVVLESIKAYQVEKYIKHKDISDENEIRYEVKYRIMKGTSNGRTANDNSYIIGEIKAGKLKSIGNGNEWGPSGNYINTDYNVEVLKEVPQITLEIHDIMLSVKGNWVIPISIQDNLEID